jgi:hypothetical protein
MIDDLPAAPYIFAPVYDTQRQPNYTIAAPKNLNFLFAISGNEYMRKN